MALDRRAAARDRRTTLQWCIAASRCRRADPSSDDHGDLISPIPARHVDYANQRRGYLRCQLTTEHMTVDFRVVPYVTGSADAPIATDRSFVVEADDRTVHLA